MSEPEPWSGVQEVAEHLGKTVPVIQSWARQGKIPGIKPGRDWMFRMSEIDAHLSAPKDSWAQSNQSRGRRRK